MLRVSLLTAALATALLLLSAARGDAREPPGTSDSSNDEAALKLVDRAKTLFRVDRRRRGEALKLVRRAEKISTPGWARAKIAAPGYLELSAMADVERLARQALDSGFLAAGSMDERIMQEYLGRALLHRGEKEQAEALLNRAARGLDDVNSRRPELYYGCPYQALGELYYQRGRATAGMRAYQKAADIERNDRQSQRLAAEASLDQGDILSASRYYLRALALCEHVLHRIRYGAWVEALQSLRRKERASAAPFSPLEVRLNAAAQLVGAPLLRLTTRRLADFVEMGWLSGARDRGLEQPLTRTAFALRLEAALRLLFRPILPDHLTWKISGGLASLIPRSPGVRGAPAPYGAAPTHHEPCVGLAVRFVIADFLDNAFTAASQGAEDLLTLPRGILPPRHRPVLLAVKGYVLLVRQQYEAAEAVFNELGNLNGAQELVNVGRGHLAIVRQDYPAAVGLLLPTALLKEGRLASMTPDSGSETVRLLHRMACLGMAWVEANQNRNREAIAHYQRILRRSPDDLFALLGMGNSLSALALFPRAERLFRRVLALDSHNAFAHAEMGLLHYNRGDDAAAMAAFSTALKQNRERYTCPYEGMGLVYLRQGKLDEAKRNFKRAISISPDIEYKKYNGLARIYLREGKVGEARQLLRKSMKNYPHDPEAGLLLKKLD